MRELVILGTAAQVPTRERNHNGYFLHWDNDGFLFDPGEGTQRQMTYADISASSISHIALSHFHGDHCLGLPGVIQRLNLDKSSRTVKICFPSGGQSFYEAMTQASLYQSIVEIKPYPIETAGVITENNEYIFSCLPLEHRTECYGYRFQEKDQRTLDISEIQRRNIKLQGPQLGELKKNGFIQLENGEILNLSEVSTHRPGQSFAFIMDTRICDNAYKLAHHADIIICEATFLDSEELQAREYMHLTARQAAMIAKESGCGMLILSHFSQRYLNLNDHLKQAREVFENTFIAHDLDRFVFPKRQRVFK